MCTVHDEGKMVVQKIVLRFKDLVSNGRRTLDPLNYTISAVEIFPEKWALKVAIKRVHLSKNVKKRLMLILPL